MESLTSSAQVRVISREMIPAIFSNNEQHKIRDIGKLQIFEQHPTLKQFLPASAKLSFAWAQLDYGKTLAIHSHTDAAALIIIYKGTAELEGQISGAVKAGDIILVPPNCAYGLINVGKEGLHALSITFNKEEFAKAQSETYELTFTGLLAHNEQRLKQTLANPFFKMLQSGVLKDAKKRQIFLDSLQIFGDFFQIMMLSRQATCIDPRFKPIFLEHLQEELGHDELFATRKHANKSNDFILKATSAWFSHQMFLLDNVEKTVIVHLILEVCGYYYHSYTKDQVSAEMNSNYYDIHAENDEHHAEMSLALLKDLHVNTYKRLHQVLDEGWDMLNAMQNRVAFLVQNHN